MNTNQEMRQYYQWLDDGVLQGDTGKEWVLIQDKEELLYRDITYRKKPEPEVFYVNKHLNGYKNLYSSEDSALIAKETRDDQYEYVAKRFTADE